MKSIYLIFFLMAYSNFINCQVFDESYKELTLTETAPNHLPERLKNINDAKFGILDSGIDSLILTFSTYPKNGHIMCLTHLKNGASSSYQVSYLKPNDSSDFLIYETEVDIIPYTKYLSFRVLKDISTDKFYYTWFNGKSTQKNIIVLETNNPIKLNGAMPYFKVEKINKEEISSNELLGSWVVLNWWATSCKPCIGEMPGLNKLVKMYEHNDKIKFIAIARDKREQWESFLYKKEFNYTQTLSNDSTNLIFGDSYPKNIILDPKGIVRYYSEGGYEQKYLELDGVLKKHVK